MFVASLAAALVLAAIHLFGGGLRFLDRIPRSRWLSAAGGAAVAYIFLHLLPELEDGKDVLADVVGTSIKHPVFLVALLGLTAFYGLERLVKREQPSIEGERAIGEGESTVSDGVFWLHIGSFFLYNLLIGYLLLHSDDEGTSAFWLYVLAMGLHFLANDYALRQDHRDTYDHTARWWLAGAVIVGWALGVWVTLPEAAIVTLLGLLGGGVVLNVLKEELPEERKSHFGAFLLGVVGYAALLMLA